MIPVGPVKTLNRSILRTGKQMSGTGGDDFICGHCGHVMLDPASPRDTVTKGKRLPRVLPGEMNRWRRRRSAPGTTTAVAAAMLAFAQGREHQLG